MTSSSPLSPSETPYSDKLQTEPDEAGYTVFHSSICCGGRYPAFPGRYCCNARKPPLLQGIDDAVWNGLVADLNKTSNWFIFLFWLYVAKIVVFFSLWLLVLLPLLVTWPEIPDEPLQIIISFVGVAVIIWFLYEFPHAMIQRMVVLDDQVKLIVFRRVAEFNDQGFDIVFDKTYVATESWYQLDYKESCVIFRRIQSSSAGDTGLVARVV